MNLGFILHLNYFELEKDYFNPTGSASNFQPSAPLLNTEGMFI